jgi:LmbE family N-acetylglucosaminyl deacetylase
MVLDAVSAEPTPVHQPGELGRNIAHGREHRTPVAFTTPWQHDGHPDHDAVGRAAELACHARDRARPNA